MLCDRKYHLIQHFNGWAFDERVIMTRMSLFEMPADSIQLGVPPGTPMNQTLLDYYLECIKTIRGCPMYGEHNIDPTNQFTNNYKIPGAEPLRNLCKNMDSLRPSLDVRLLG